MAQVLSPISSPPAAAAAAAAPTPIRPENRSLSLDIATAFSPVDERGAFMHEKVFKEGWLHQRTRKTKNWKRRWYVLRGSVIGIYKDDSEKKLHRQIQLSELTACAPLKADKRPHIFGLFSPGRNYHLQASDDKSLDDWVKLIREAACLEETDEQLLLSPTAAETQPIPIPGRASLPHAGPSSPPTRPHDAGVGSFTLDYSGASMSSTSELGGMISQSSLAMPMGGEPNNSVLRPISPPATAATAISNTSFGTTAAQQGPAAPEIGVQRQASELSELEGQLNESRVVWHGYLYVLKSKSSIRQWKKIWVVLRPRNVTFYKNDEEYSPLKLIPLENVIDAVEINPISKSKQHCMQLILDNKSYRFAASNEETLTKWLGAYKSTLAKSRR
ncbi:hypothetical protein DRE_02278 [Drechslerella stenobrocha 248]|uniref:PH domain-containing protein n=1 Tax=Drechslerella stenobrocha 248 TaxID=1043628 RepID=W7HXD5_9PEZI|nr:hypothetical protein DRE_02278 [Drechslerella stenobrocha 248]